MFSFYTRLAPLMCYAPDDGAAGGSDAAAGGTTGANAGDNAANTTGGEKTFTQAELDKVLTARLAREKASIRKEVADELKAEADKAKLDESERLKLEKTEADNKAKAATDAANTRIIRAEARVLAVEAGVKAERLPHFLRMVDLSSVTVDDAGEPDAGAIKAAIAAVLKDVPEFKGESGAASGGTDVRGGAGGTALTQEIIDAMTPQELAKRMPEVTAFYSNKRK